MVLFTLVASAVLRFTGFPSLVNPLLFLGIGVGSWQLLRDSIRSLQQGSFALDYIAILAILTGVLTGNYFVAGVIVLMMSGGNTLESYAQELAKRSLTTLSNRIPHDVLLVTENKEVATPLKSVTLGSTLKVRKGEVIPLEGTLLSKSALIDESSLTGEAYPVSKISGELLHSGTINQGETLLFRTTVTDENSSYRQIIRLVEQAQSEKTPFLQLADKLSGWFTVVTLLLATVAYLLSQDMERVLAVLVIATPCPLILATPVALIGGMNTAAKERIIFKRLAALEVLSRVKVMIFDKTGTLTFGVPELLSIEGAQTEKEKSQFLALAAGLERNSLHPYAKSILEAAEKQHIQPKNFGEIEEQIGKGIRGKHNGHTYTVQKAETTEGVALRENGKVIATFVFSDVLKPNSVQILKKLQKQQLRLALFTGDSQERTLAQLPNLPSGIEVAWEMKPEQKLSGIRAYQKNAQSVAMIGDGINDAPALAAADVGIAFSHDEKTAASEAADVVLLGNDFASVLHARQISQRTLSIAKQSMYVGLGLSLTGMCIALTGKLPPLAGAITQEVIDVAVILNALRAAFPKK